MFFWDNKDKLRAQLIEKQARLDKMARDFQGATSMSHFHYEMMLDLTAEVAVLKHKLGE